MLPVVYVACLFCKYLYNNVNSPYSASILLQMTHIVCGICESKYVLLAAREGHRGVRAGSEKEPQRRCSGQQDWESSCQDSQLCKGLHQSKLMLGKDFI